MKKVISMVMAAAMVTSLVPATAFAASYTYDVNATAKIVNAKNYSDKNNSFDGKITQGPEMWLTVNNASYSADQTASGIVTKFNVVLENGILDNTNAPAISFYDYVTDTRITGSTVESWTANGGDGKVDGSIGSDYAYELVRVDDDEFEVTIKRGVSTQGDFTDGDRIIVSLGALDAAAPPAQPVIAMDSYGRGRTVTASVSSDDIEITNANTEMTFASVEAKGITASTRKTVTVAVDEYTPLENIVLKPAASDTFTFAAGDEIRLKPSSGFEFDKNKAITVTSDDAGASFGAITYDKDEIVIPMTSAVGGKKIEISGLYFGADTAKEGKTGSVKVYATDCPAVDVEVAKVTAFAVSMTVDADEDLPVIYSGVDVENTGITDGSDHMSLEVTIKESFPGAWNNAKDFTLTLPEGVYAVDHVKLNDGVQGSTIKTDIAAADGGFIGDKAKDSKIDTEADMQKWFADAYEEGEYDNLTFEKRTWNESNPKDHKTGSEIRFRLQLVADPNFEGDVTLKLEGDAMETQEVKIAKFVKPYTVKAEQNDLKIDYRRTEIPTSITITEAAPGLWKKGTTFHFGMEKISFDDGATYTVDEKSGMTIKDEDTLAPGRGGNATDNDVLTFTVDKTSSDEAATVTLSGMSLYMERSLPAGAYSLTVTSPTMENGVSATGTYNYGLLHQPVLGHYSISGGKVVNDINSFYDDVAKEGFVNIITSGREDSDSFTTKVTVPVGEKYLISGETKVDLDVPAYVSAAGYTMLPVRAVAKALGIPNENVIWNAEARTATIMYGSKIITMTIGQKTMYVNGAPVPTSAAVEIKEENGVGRAFLPMRDLGVALGVADITWDAATKTATLNGSK